MPSVSSYWQVGRKIIKRICIAIVILEGKMLQASLLCYVKEIGWPTWLTLALVYFSFREMFLSPISVRCVYFKYFTARSHHRSVQISAVGCHCDLDLRCFLGPRC